MGQSLPFTIRSVVACEDIREEKFGKHTLVGVYSGDTIQVAQIPGNIAIACFIEFEIQELGVHELGLKLSGPGKHEATLKARLSFSETGVFAVIATPRIDLLADEEGTLCFDIGSDAGGWQRIVTRKIVHNPDIVPFPE